MRLYEVVTADFVAVKKGLKWVKSVIWNKLHRWASNVNYFVNWKLSLRRALVFRRRLNVLLLIVFILDGTSWKENN